MPFSFYKLEISWVVDEKSLTCFGQNTTEMEY